MLSSLGGPATGQGRNSSLKGGRGAVEDGTCTINEKRMRLDWELTGLSHFKHERKNNVDTTAEERGGGAQEWISQKQKFMASSKKTDPFNATTISFQRRLVNWEDLYESTFTCRYTKKLATVIL